MKKYFGCAKTFSPLRNILFAGLCLAFSPAAAQVTTPSPAVCDRTAEVRDVIVAAVNGDAGVKTCADITAEELAAITGLLALNSMSIASLLAGDFNGLSGVTELALYFNDLTALPAGVFNEITALTKLELDGNDLAVLPAGVFDQLTALQNLNLNENELTVLPAGIFDQLAALDTLSLNANPLTELSADVFDQLALLQELDLSNTSLTSIAQDIFVNTDISSRAFSTAFVLIPSEPQELSVTAGDESLHVNWMPPARQPHGIHTYKLRWRASSATTFAAADAAFTATTVNTHTIEGLTNDTEYTVAVTALSNKLNNDRDGALRNYVAANLIAGKYATATATPVSANASSADLLALSLHDQDGNLLALDQTVAAATATYTVTVPKVITSFTVTATSAGGGTSGLQLQRGGDAAQSQTSGVAGAAQILEFGTNTFSLTITSPDMSTTKVYAVTVTRTNVPDAPDAPTVTAPATGGDTEMRVEWDALPAARTNGARITEYRVRWGESTNDGTTPAWTDPDGEGTLASIVNSVRFPERFLNVRNLTPATQYDVQIVAVNSDGRGEWSASAQHTTAAGSDARLSALRINGAGGNTGEITPTPGFMAEIFTYSAAVANDSDGITLTPTYVGGGASLTYDGATAAANVASSATSAKIPVEAGASVTALLTVTAQNGMDMRTYTINISRAPAPRSVLDVNDDGMHDDKDGFLIVRYLLGLRDLSLAAGVIDASLVEINAIEKRIAAEVDAKSFNINGDDDVTAADSMIISRYLLGVTSGDGLIKGQSDLSAAEVVQKIETLLNQPAGM